MYTSPSEPGSRPAIGTTASAAASARDAGPMSLLGAMNALLRQRWTIAGSALLAATAVAAFTLAQPREYAASASFVPQSSNVAASGLSGFASQLGLNVGEGAATESPAFYADLLLSRELLGSVADRDFRVPGDSARRAPLADIIEVDARGAALRRHRVLEYLRKHVGAAVTPKTGAVVLTVTTRSPMLSHDIAEHLVAQVSAFNVERRQSRAVAERRFTEQRLAEARVALAEAERRLESFLVRNRQFRGAPTLEFERERLARDLNVRQQLFLTLSEAHERARIDEVRDTPVITVVDAPERPALPARRLLLLKTTVGLLAGALFGVVLALLRHAVASTRRTSAEEYAEFEALRREAIADLKRPWRPLRREARRVAAS